ncbi:MAG: hypothetical protein LW720_09005 [Pirellula sp.]|nr:hypothetical protein [Pirellula sp.]
MPPDPHQIEEWLSGMLDGALTEQEQRQLELAMQNDPSIAELLEQMAELRRSLLRGRSVGRLGADFSKRVVQAAQRQAAQLDSPPAWVLPGAPNAREPAGQEPLEDLESLWSETYSKVQRPVPEALDIHPVGRRQKAIVRGLMGSHEEPQRDPGTIRGRLVRVWLPSLAVVAALCVLLLALPRSGPTDPSQPDSVVSVMPLDVPNEPTHQEDFVPDRSLAGSPETEPSKMQLPATEPLGNGLNAGSKSPSVVSVPVVEQNNSVAGAKYILIAEIEVDPIAEQDGMLSQLLEKYEIVFSADAPLSKIDFDTLVASKVIKNPVVDPALKVDGSTVCYLVKSNPKRLDSFLTDVEKQYLDFPSYRLNLSADPNVYELMDHLGGVTDSSNVAKRLFYQESSDAQALGSFELENRGVPSDIESRKAAKPRNRVNALITQEDTYLILLVRTPK